jgi:tetratricopeptide (TPR) repeat protein
MKSLIILIFLLVSSTSFALVTGESEELPQNLSYRLAKSYYNIGSYQRAIRLLRKAIKEAKDNQAAEQLLVDSYSELISQIHIEYIALHFPEILMQGISQEVEQSLTDVFEARPSLRYWFCSKFYYFRGLFYILFGNRARANESFIDSLAYDPTNYKSLLWLARSIMDEFPTYSGEIIKYIQSFAGIMPQIEKDKAHHKLAPRFYVDLLFPKT